MATERPPLSLRCLHQMQSNQLWWYFAAVAAAAFAGLAWPSATSKLAAGINPALGLLIFATFLEIPLTKIARGFANRRFVVAALTLNFAIVPALVWLLTRMIADSPALLIGALLVLLAPCIDYVIVFAGMAGAETSSLLAITPVLLGFQMFLLPIYLGWMDGGALPGSIDLTPFVGAFVVLILIPLLAALLVQLLAPRFRPARHVASVCEALMIPLMMVVLFLVIASQIGQVQDHLAELRRVLPVYALFLLVMIPVGLLWARIFKLERGDMSALVFSGGTRNSLVVLPIALAMPATLAIVPAVVVAQTIVELIGMLLYLNLVPRLTGGTVQPSGTIPSA